MPNSINMPDLEKSQDINVNFGTARHNGAQFQGTYAITKQIGVMYNAMWFKEKNKHSANLHELGLGWYKPINHITLSAFGGYGLGKLQYIDKNPYDSPFPTSTKYAFLDLSLDRWFLQSSFFYKINYFYMGLGYRYSHLRYIKGSIDLRISDPDSFEAMRHIEEESPFSLSEISAAFGFRFSRIKFGLNFTAVPVYNQKQFNNLNFEPVNVSMHVGINLDREFWKSLKK